jgi:MFS family permease
MSKAALELHTVQSNVTARVKALESELGTALFERSHRGASLTSAGRRLMPYARQVAHLLEDAARAAQDEGTPSGALAIGALALLCTALVFCAVSSDVMSEAKTPAPAGTRPARSDVSPTTGVGSALAAPASPPLGRLILAYGLFGFGYSVTATFLVTMVRESPTVRPLAPWIWILFGLAAVPSVPLWTQLAALLLGGTFMGITTLALTGAQKMGGGQLSRVLGWMTASFAAGQMVGPTVAGTLADRFGSFRLPSGVAAAARKLAEVDLSRRP